MNVSVRISVPSYCSKVPSLVVVFGWYLSDRASRDLVVYLASNNSHRHFAGDVISK